MTPRVWAGGLGAFEGGVVCGGEGGCADAGWGGVGVWVLRGGPGSAGRISMSSSSSSLLVLEASFCRLGRGTVVRLQLASWAASES